MAQGLSCPALALALLSDRPMAEWAQDRSTDPFWLLVRPSPALRAPYRQVHTSDTTSSDLRAAALKSNTYLTLAHAKAAGQMTVEASKNSASS
jgi:hypothetical protein